MRKRQDFSTCGEAPLGDPAVLKNWLAQTCRIKMREIILECVTPPEWSYLAPLSSLRTISSQNCYWRFEVVKKKEWRRFHNRLDFQKKLRYWKYRRCHCKSSVTFGIRISNYDKVYFWCWQNCVLILPSSVFSSQHSVFWCSFFISKMKNCTATLKKKNTSTSLKNTFFGDHPLSQLSYRGVQLKIASDEPYLSYWSCKTNVASASTNS